MKAVIQGEFHTSGTDQGLLDSHLDADVDALFVEQREDRVSPVNWSLGYLTFLVGALSLYWLQAFLYNGPDIKEKASVPVHDEIDTDLPRLYPQFPKIWRLGLGLFSGFIFATGLLLSSFSLPLIDEPVIISIIYTVLVKLLLVAGAPFLFSCSLVYLEERRIGIRDQDMANEIHRISNENGYETVVVSCGNAHLHRLPHILEKKGWETEVNESSHSWIGKFWRW